MENIHPGSNLGNFFKASFVIHNAPRVILLKIDSQIDKICHFAEFLIFIVPPHSNKKAPRLTELFVDDTGLEPVTPTMSR